MPYCSVLQLKSKRIAACMAGLMNNLAWINETKGTGKKRESCSEPHLIQFQHQDTHLSYKTIKTYKKKREREKTFKSNKSHPVIIIKVFVVSVPLPFEFG